MVRSDGRGPRDLRPANIEPGYLKYAEGSALITLGETKVLCSASVEEKVPPFLKGSSRGWITAEYSLLPRSTKERTAREAAKGRVSGRTHEIQRLIGRALRSVVDLAVLGERTIWIDCDVIQADGGTRTAAITGGFVALIGALHRLLEAGVIPRLPVQDFLAATSVGVVGGELLLDLAFEEDSMAQVDMNVVMTGRGQLVEVQGTAEGATFSRAEMDAMLDLAWLGIRQLIQAQKEALGDLALKVGASDAEEASFGHAEQR
ncbi:ribonuclease PH [Moorellaceae bacterium AZ2]